MIRLLFPFFSLLLFNLSFAQAAEIYFADRAGPAHVGDIFVVEAKISSLAELINVADGAILFDKNSLEAKELSAGGSIFSLWAQQPDFSNETGRISFIGGTPESFQGENGLMLKAIFLAKKEGKSQLAFSDDFSVLLSDGKGTKISPQRRGLTLNIIERPFQISPKDEWRDFIAGDTAPPEFVEAIISRDSRIFEGRYFISFFANDAESGVLYYEVKEGDRDFARAVSPYVLQDQGLDGLVLVKAVDGAGNESVITAEMAPAPAPFYKSMMFWIIMTLIIIGALFIKLRKLKL